MRPSDHYHIQEGLKLVDTFRVIYFDLLATTHLFTSERWHTRRCEVFLEDTVGAGARHLEEAELAKQLIQVVENRCS